MSTRTLFILLALAFCCLGGFVAEGRLFATTRSTDTVTDTDTGERPVSIDSATTKFHNFVVVESSSSSQNGSSVCDRIRPDELPEECSCTESGPYSLVIECHKVFNSTYFNDTIGMKIDLDPCNEEGAKLSLDVTEMDHDIDFPLVGIRAGESKNVPIPGLAMIVPGVGNVGLDVAVLIAGNPDMLRLKVGLNACAQLSTDHQLCASSIPGLSTILPWWVLKGTYSFGDICGSSSVVAVAGASGSDDTEENTAIATE